MGQDQPQFADLMADAWHAVRALDGADGSRFPASVVRDGRRIYSELLDYRKSASMTVAQAALVQRALDLIWVRLRAAKVG